MSKNVDRENTKGTTKELAKNKEETENLIPQIETEPQILSFNSGLQNDESLPCNEPQLRNSENKLPQNSEPFINGKSRRNETLQNSETSNIDKSSKIEPPRNIEQFNNGKPRNNEPSLDNETQLFSNNDPHVNSEKQSHIFSIESKLPGNITKTKNNEPGINEPSPANEPLLKNEPSNEIELCKETINIVSTETNKAPQGKPPFVRWPIVKLWFVLILTLGFTILLMIGSHFTHSLALRVETYHALYNVMALSGCLFTMKIWERPASIKNTFGWARVEVLSCLCSLLFVASFCFSVGMESIQTAAHAGHQDPMHHPLEVIYLGVIGVALNVVVFLLIGGYTHHQGCFLQLRGSDVWVQKRNSNNAVQAGMRTLLHQPQNKANPVSLSMSYESMRGFARDVAGLIIVLLCATVVYFDVEGTFALYVDPGFALISVTILLYLSYPYGKECCFILLQTIPGNIDVQSFSAKLLEEFPEVVNIHHLHIWSLTPGKVVATAHVVYSNPKVFHRSVDALKQFFMDKDIAQVTLQPEFLHYSSQTTPALGNSECLIKCNQLCREKECCDDFSCDESDEEKSSNKLIQRHVQGVCHHTTGSLNVNVSGDHHGTSAFRRHESDVRLIRSLSKEDLAKNELKQSLRKPLSCNLGHKDETECLYICEKIDRIYQSTNF